MSRQALTTEMRSKARDSLYPFVFETDEGKSLLRSLQSQDQNTTHSWEEIRRLIQVEGQIEAIKNLLNGMNEYLKQLAHQLADRWVDIGERFLAAAEDADSERLEALAAQGAPVNYHDPQNGATALHYVASRGSRPALRVLLKTGECDFLARDNKGRLVSEMAGVYGRDLVMERLLLIKEIRQARQTGVPLNHIYRRDHPVRPAPPSP
jgi:hypothetical protein